MRTSRAVKRLIPVMAGVVGSTFAARAAGSVAAIVAIAAVTIGPFTTGVADAASAPSAAPMGRFNPVWPNAAREEAAFVADINAMRASRGLPALRVRSDLTRKARLWAPPWPPLKGYGTHGYRPV